MSALLLRGPLTDAQKRDLAFRALLGRYRIAIPSAEHRFHEARKWRFDYAWPDRMLALEVEGGFFPKRGAKGSGRHSRGAGARADMEKYNAAVLLGWRVLRVMPDQLCQDATLRLLAHALGES